MRARDESRQGLALADAAAATHADAGGADLAEPSTAQLRSIGSAPTAALGSAALHSLGPSASAVATLALVNGAHFYTICSLFPYAGFLAVDSGWADDVDSAGYVAGYLATATLLARIPTSVAWGYAADRWGWYPAVQLSLASLAMGSLAFGLARPLWAALLSRIVFLGGLNGWPALTGVVCGEVGGEGGQARVLSRVIGAGPIFGLIGPAVGGWTYNLVPWLPPALPPNLFGAALALVTMLAAHRYLRPQGAHAPDPTPSFGAKTGGARLAPADEGAGLGEAATVISPGPPAADSPDRQPSRTSLSARPSTRLVTWELLLVMLFRAMSGLVMFLIWDVFPLFCIASRGAGGLELSHSQLGSLLAAAAVLQAAYMLCASARVISRLGAARVVLLVGAVQGGSLALLAVSASAPLPLLALLYALNGCCNASSLVVAIAATNVHGARHPARKGAIQGVATSLESVAKAAGPVLGASLFATALNAGGARAFFNALALTLAISYGGVGAALLYSSLERGRAPARRKDALEPPFDIE